MAAVSSRLAGMTHKPRRESVSRSHRHIHTRICEMSYTIDLHAHGCTDTLESCLNAVIDIVAKGGDEAALLGVRVEAIKAVLPVMCSVHSRVCGLVDDCVEVLDEIKRDADKIKEQAKAEIKVNSGILKDLRDIHEESVFENTQKAQVIQGLKGIEKQIEKLSNGIKAEKKVRNAVNNKLLQMIQDTTHELDNKFNHEMHEQENMRKRLKAMIGKTSFEAKLLKHSKKQE